MGEAECSDLLSFLPCSSTEELADRFADYFEQ